MLSVLRNLCALVRVYINVHTYVHTSAHSIQKYTLRLRAHIHTYKHTHTSKSTVYTHAGDQEVQQERSRAGFSARQVRQDLGWHDEDVPGEQREATPNNGAIDTEDSFRADRDLSNVLFQRCVSADAR